MMKKIIALAFASIVCTESAYPAFPAGLNLEGKKAYLNATYKKNLKADLQANRDVRFDDLIEGQVDRLEARLNSASGYFWNNSPKWPLAIDLIVDDATRIEAKRNHLRALTANCEDLTLPDSILSAETVVDCEMLKAQDVWNALQMKISVYDYKAPIHSPIKDLRESLSTLEQRPDSSVSMFSARKLPILKQEMQVALRAVSNDTTVKNAFFAKVAAIVYQLMGARQFSLTGMASAGAEKAMVGALAAMTAANSTYTAANLTHFMVQGLCDTKNTTASCNHALETKEELSVAAKNLTATESVYVVAQNDYVLAERSSQLSLIATGVLALAVAMKIVSILNKKFLVVDQKSWTSRFTYSLCLMSVIWFMENLSPNMTAEILKAGLVLGTNAAIAVGVPLTEKCADIFFDVAPEGTRSLTRLVTAIAWSAGTRVVIRGQEGLSFVLGYWPNK